MEYFDGITQIERKIENGQREREREKEVLKTVFLLQNSRKHIKRGHRTCMDSSVFEAELKTSQNFYETDPMDGIWPWRGKFLDPFPRK